MKHKIITLAIGIALALSVGCQTVEKTLNKMPQVSAEKIHVTTSNLYGSAQLDAVNLQQGEAVVTADSITVQVSAPFAGTTTVQIDGYRREKQPEAEPAK